MDEPPVSKEQRDIPTNEVDEQLRKEQVIDFS